jgi:hypothetical protein
MDNKIIVHKKYFTCVGEVQRFRAQVTSLFGFQRLASTLGARVYHGQPKYHVTGHYAHRAVQTLLEECLGCGPLFIHKPIKDILWQM